MMITITLPMVARLKTAARNCYRTGELRRMGHLMSSIGDLAELMRDDADQRGPVDPKDYTTVLEAIIQRGDAVAQSLLRQPEQTPDQMKDEVPA
jgi:hypothetical protein